MGTITQQVGTLDQSEQLRGLVKSLGPSIPLDPGEKRSGAALSPGKTRYRLF